MIFKSSQIASFLGLPLNGDVIDVCGYSSLSNIEENTVVFAKKYSSQYVSVLNSNKKNLAIVTEQYIGKISCSYIVSTNPRLDYIKVLSNFFPKREIKSGIDSTATVSPKASIGDNVSIGAHCFIGDECIIGSGTTIMPNVSIIGKVEMGKNCLVKPGAVIGGAGFGFEYDENGVPFHFPHTGSVKIGNNVQIGSNTCIDRATIDCTYIGENVKIDNLCQIAHNCQIGDNTLITGGAMISGGVKIGKNCWIGPNSVIYQQLTIEDNSLVGIGAVVIKKVKSGKTVFGNPAKNTSYE